MSLEGKVVLVTGAARRIGRGIALRLAREGARVAIHYGASENDARATARECGDAPVFQADLAEVDEIQRLFAAVADHFGRLDGLVNNAARYTRIDPLEVTESDWDEVHNVNLKAVFFCCQQAARIMLSQETGGRIVNISSLGALQAWPLYAHYCASKAGVVHMTRALAKAWGPKVALNSIAPGYVPFDAHDAVWEHLVAQTPAGRPGTADDIAAGVLFFLTAPDYVTGQLLPIDGGLSVP